MSTDTQPFDTPVEDRESEVWVSVVGYEHNYLISSHGNIKSLSWNRTGSPKNLILIPDKDGFGFPTWESLKWDNDFGTNWDDTVKTFEHIESAEQYILENKPCLSLWDLVCMDLHITKEGMDFLRKKAKEKLCPKP